MKTAKEQLNEFLSLKENWYGHEDNPPAEPFNKEEHEWFLENIWNPLIREIPECEDVYIYPLPDNSISLEWSHFRDFEVGLEVSLSNKIGIICITNYESNPKPENKVLVYIGDLDLTNNNVLNSIIQLLKLTKIASTKEFSNNH